MAGFFKKLVGLAHRAGEELPSAKLRSLYEIHAGLSREKQFALQELLDKGAGQGDWHVSLHTGTLSLNNGRYVYPIQFLGTRSDQSNTWLWAWADRGPGYPALPRELLTSVNQLRAFGEKEQVPELISPGFELGSHDRQMWFDVHFLGQIACGLCDADFYVGVPYQGGEMLVVFNASDIKAHADPRLLTIRMTGFFLDLGSVLPIDRFDHGKILQAYAHQKGFTVAANSNRQMEWTMPTGDRLVAVFDNFGRVMSCSVFAGTHTPAVEGEAGVPPNG